MQLNNNTDHILGANALRSDFSNGTLLRTLEQQQDKGTAKARTIGLCFRKVLPSLAEGALESMAQRLIFISPSSRGSVKSVRSWE